MLKTFIALSMLGVGVIQTVTEERQYVFPQYTEIAPCPCDISPGCDTYCCCDPSCPTDPPPFPCLPGLPGGQEEGKLQEFNCSEPAPLASGSSFFQLNAFLHPLLCIQTTNSPYLGHYHRPSPKLESQVKQETVKKRKGDKKKRKGKRKESYAIYIYKVIDQLTALWCFINIFVPLFRC